MKLPEKYMDKMMDTLMRTRLDLMAEVKCVKGNRES